MRYMVGKMKIENLKIMGKKEYLPAKYAKYYKANANNTLVKKNCFVKIREIMFIVCTVDRKFNFLLCFLGNLLIEIGPE